MPKAQEYNQFRRLVGDFAHSNITTQVIDTYLNDATAEVTADFVTTKVESPVLDSPEFNQFESSTTVTPAQIMTFDELYIQFHPEVIYKAAINWWWNRASEFAGHLTTTIGSAAQNVSELYERCILMIQQLETHYQAIQQLGLDIQMGNISYFNKRYLQRAGGQREESALTQGEGGQPGDLWYG